ncbi:hypothetical protein [Calothrix sp. NIES-3974]|uniref:hypothetical protein n=1 Tax=Calothrix sp. NIES-3974 TaxID=2005462 RepID=UPI000B60DEDB|nr:hypothetical protein [Calothrix sp. NIES-3974]BAZ07621.1 hypothetical protein NIES3974_42850 [Calothrix sp. NIES-3974]
MPSKPWKISFSGIILTSCGLISYLDATNVRVAALSLSPTEKSHVFKHQEQPQFKDSTDHFPPPSIKQLAYPSGLTKFRDDRFPGLQNPDNFVVHNWDNISLTTSSMIISPREVKGNQSLDRNFESDAVIISNINPGLDLNASVTLSQHFLAQVEFASDSPDLELSNQAQPSPSSVPEPLSPRTEPSREPPQLDAQPSEIPTPSPQQIEQRLSEPVSPSYEQRRARLLKILENRRNLRPNRELGDLLVRESPDFVPPLEQQPPPSPRRPPEPFGYFFGHVSYFQTDNLFSSRIDRIDDGLIYGGLRFVTTPIPLGSRTFLSGSVGGNLIRYINQSEFNYNQFRVSADIFYRFNRRMYGEFGWSNQQLFYSRSGEQANFQAGDRFLNEHSWHVSIGRRDPLSSQWIFDSYYELRASFTDPPANRDRIINTLFLGLNYYPQSPLQVGLNYQYYRADFTERDRDDQYHRLFTSLNYRLSNISNLNLQAGYTFGDSTQSDVDFNGWFFSLTYGWELGRF